MAGNGWGAMNTFVNGLLFAACLLPSSPATATTISFGPTPFNGPSIIPQSVSLPQFDPAMGSLTGVTIQVGVSFSNVIGLMSNDLGRPVSDSFQTAFVSSVTSVGGLWFPITSTFTGSSVLPPGQSPFIFSSALTFSSGSPLSIGPYIGLGGIIVSVSTAATIGQPIVGGASRGVVILGGNILGDAGVIYAFTPIPEPSTMLLFGTGLAGLAAWRYRKGMNA